MSYIERKDYMAIKINMSGIKMSDDSTLLKDMKIKDSSVDISIENFSIKGNANILDGKVYDKKM